MYLFQKLGGNEMKNKVALVTGGTSGIRKEIVK